MQIPTIINKMAVFTYSRNLPDSPTRENASNTAEFFKSFKTLLNLPPEGLLRNSKTRYLSYSILFMYS